MIRALLSGQHLEPEAAAWAMGQVLAGQATDAQTAGFAIALRAKGETADEVQAMVEVMLAHAQVVPGQPDVLDVVGTGGDHSNTVNISTMAALVAVACGARVVKHGNRAVSSQTGTADVLEELGVVIELPPAAVRRCADEAGIGFAFAPVHHPAMRHAAQARRDLGVPTVFNILGPLTNPARARAALIGCADAGRAPVMASVLAGRGVRALVVRGDDGLDEVSTVTTTSVWDASTMGAVATEVVDPSALGVQPARPELLVGGDRGRNAALLRMAIGADPVGAEDAERIEAIRDAVALNAAVALVAWDAANEAALVTEGRDSVVARASAHVDRTRQALACGAAAEVLQRWVQVSRASAAS